MPLAFADGKTIFFAHVPKTGGTSMEAYLDAASGLSRLPTTGDTLASRGRA